MSELAPTADVRQVIAIFALRARSRDRNRPPAEAALLIRLVLVPMQRSLLCIKVFDDFSHQGQRQLVVYQGPDTFEGGKLLVDADAPIAHQKADLPQTIAAPANLQ
jgi:hypothetical protein